MNLPQEYAKRMQSLLADEYDDYVAALHKAPVRALAVNKNKISPEKFVAECGFALSPLGFSDSCFLLGTNEKAGRTPFHHGGAFYMQEPGAMLPVIAAGISKDDIVLDLCAAPGGKTIQAAYAAKSVVSNEIDGKRAVTLAGNVERMGLKNTVVTNYSPADLENYFPEYFDAVIVDAPCSGEGMFRKEAAAVANWSKENVLSCADRQRKILCSADRMLSGGGKLLYSTCTFSAEENEENVDFLIKELGYTLLAPTADVVPYSRDGVMFGDVNPACARRVYPHNCVGEGQFFAVLVKPGNARKGIKIIKAPSADKCKPYAEFCNKYMTAPPNAEIFGDSVIARGADYPDKMRAVVRGVKLGEISGSRFVPSHNLYTAFGTQMKHVVELSDRTAMKYLEGEEIPADADGYVALSYKGVILGGGKGSGGVVKNHYPKGLRNKNA